MPARSAAEKAERKLRQQEKREARKLAKEQKHDPKNLTSGTPDNENSGCASTNVITTGAKQESLLLRLPDVAMHSILCCLPSRDVGCLTMTCRLFNEVLGECRVPYLMSRIHRPKQPLQGGVGFIDLCSDEGEARYVSYVSLQVTKASQSGKTNHNPNFILFVSTINTLPDAPHTCIHDTE